MRAILLAGGLGTRLRERVAEQPKAMAPVAGRPFIDYLLTWLAQAGCQCTVLATGYRAEAIRQHVGSAFSNMPVFYSHETHPLGTGGAVRQALALLGDDLPALVLNADTWTGLNLNEFKLWCDQEPGADAMVLREVDDVSRFGSVKVQDGRVVSFGEKQTSGAGLINAGAYWLRASSLEGFSLPEAFSLEKEHFEPHASALNLRAFVSRGDFIDIGVPSEFDRAQFQFAQMVGTA